MRTRLLPLLVALPILLTAACGGEDTSTPARAQTVTVVGQNSTEADVVSELYRQLLDQAGFRTKVRSIGARDLYLDPLEKGEVQVAADTLSAVAEAVNRRANGESAPVVASTRVATVLDRLTVLGRDVGITPLRPARAEVATAYAVTRQYAARHRLRTLSDLGRLGRPVTLAAASDCSERQDCADGLENVYGVELARIEPLGQGTPDTKTALARGQVQLAQVATTDADLDAEGLVILEDDRSVQLAENLLPLVNTEWLAEHAEARAALDRLAGVLTTEDLRALDVEVNQGRKKPAAAAEDYLRRQGLLQP